MILFDVGTHDGHFFLRNGDHRFRADLNPAIRVHAFEAQPDLAFNLQQRLVGYPNIAVTHAAVSNQAGIHQFNICPDAGCSSLLEFVPDVDQRWAVNDPRWEYRRIVSDSRYRFFRHVERVWVQCLRLAGYMTQKHIDHIDYLHIDTQGSDLEVLRSLDDYIYAVMEGEMEVPSSPDKALYQGQHTKEEALDFLRDAGFKILGTSSNDPFRFEENIHFKR